MAKSKSSDMYGDDEAPTPTPEEQRTLPDTPEGLDVAIFRQGWQAARKDEANVAANPDAVKTSNPFAEGTGQAESWDAGYGA